MEEENEGKRVDVFLTLVSDVSRSQIKQICESAGVTVGGKSVKPSRVLAKGDVVSIDMPEPVEMSLVPEDIPLDIVYEDDSLAVINKQAGLVVHPSQGTPSGTPVNALLFHLKSLSSINGVIRPGIVHRIDKDTTGLLVVAKTDEAHRSLALQIAEKTAQRKYLALLDGIVKDDKGTIDAPISRSPADRKKMAVVVGGRNAVSDFVVLERFAEYSFVEFSLWTGRTHQIRVHAKYFHHPVVGDKLYNTKTDEFGLEGQLLHAYKLTFNHPVTGEKMSFEAPLPEKFQSVLELLRKRDAASVKK